MVERGRDESGRPRNTRPRDALGRLLPPGSDGVPRIPDDLELSASESLEYAQDLLNRGLAFNAHEVLEAAWKNGPHRERPLWQGLAQLAVGVTHVQRGNLDGASTLLRRGIGRLGEATRPVPHRVDVVGLVGWATALADDLDARAAIAPPRLRPILTAVPGRWAAARYPFIYEINTWPWLNGMSASGSPVDLSTVPDERWDAIADAGFDAVWLMGVWQRSPAGVAVALADAALVASFREALPDWAPADVVGSPYCIGNYQVDERLGGRTGLAAARAALADRGLALILDFVPNHVAPDHPWTSTHPEYFVHGTPAELAADPESFTDVDGRVLAKGKDPYFPAWADVVQLNAFSPQLRAAMVDTLRDVAEQCDGVRCDMAMLVMNDVFASTWGERVGQAPAEEYWPAAIGAIHQSHPNFTFIAEAYWDLEWSLQQQGFDFCYDKRLYDRLVAGEATDVIEHLRADVGYQNRLVRFIENHDEPRAAAVFDDARAKAATVATLTQTGARLVHDGQLEGNARRLPVFLGRSPREGRDPEASDFHRSLLDVLRDMTFRTGAWSLCETSGSDLAAWCWDGDRRWLVVVNLGAAPSTGRVSAPWDDLAGRTYRLTDPIADVVRTCSRDDLLDGLPVELGPWQWHLFRVE